MIKESGFSAALWFSLVMHIGAFTVGYVYRQPEIVFASGSSAMTVELLHANNRQAEDKTIDSAEVPTCRAQPHDTVTSQQPAASTRVPSKDRFSRYVAVPDTGVRSPARSVGVIAPEYPRLSRVRGEEGAVDIEVEILADGTPGRVTVVRSSGYPRLDRAAMKALDAGAFIPACVGEQRVDSTKRITFVFDLTGEQDRW